MNSPSTGVNKVTYQNFGKFANHGRFGDTLTLPATLALDAMLVRNKLRFKEVLQKFL